MGVLMMSDKERDRKAIFEMVKQSKLTLVKAAKQCDLSYRQTLRIYQEYLKRGDAGLIHKFRSRPSNRKNPHQMEIIARYRERYEGFGPTLAAEYLLEDGYNIHHETLRLWLLAEKLWKKQRKRSPHRRQRECKEQFGELVQIDGSIHDWFQTGEQSCLLNMVDDATSKTLSRLDTGETTYILFVTMWEWIKRYGIPLAMYVDLKTVYISPKKDGLSHFQVACQKLGIRVIEAHSAQAKGRVERSHKVYQDRFVKDLLLRKVQTIEGGNAVLDGGFIDNLNARFEKPAGNPASAHRPLGALDLNQILCWEYTRQVQHDWTFSFKGQYYQVHKMMGEHIRPKTRITIRQHLDGSVSAWNKNQAVVFESIAERPVKPIEQITDKPLLAAHLIQKPSGWMKRNHAFFQPTKRSWHKFTLSKRPG